MKRINQYKKLFNVEADTDLRALKKTYRNLVKEWHPDKFQDDPIKLEEADIKSQEIIDGYHFLVSIAPETKEANLDAYKKTTEEAAIVDFKHKGQVLEVSFSDGATYEYFGVSRNVYIKMVNSDRIPRFAKRSIFSSFLYRQTTKTNEVEEA